MAQTSRKALRFIALVFWLVWALFLAAALIGRAAGNPFLLSMESELKAGSSLVLVLFAWLVVFVSAGAVRQIAPLVAIGITLGFLGDASPLLGKLWPDPQRTLVNMVLFGVGHVAYIRACLLLRERASDSGSLLKWRGSLVIWLTIGCVCWYFAAMLGDRHSVMKFPALAYTLLLTATVGVSMGNALTDRRFWPVAIGAVLFLVSDLLLAVWIFHDAVYRTVDLVWITYGIGQMLIVFGFARIVTGTSSSF